MSRRLLFKTKHIRAHPKCTGQRLLNAFMESIENLYKQGDDKLEGCIGAFEEILLSEFSHYRAIRYEN